MFSQEVFLELEQKILSRQDPINDGYGILLIRKCIEIFGSENVTNIYVYPQGEGYHKTIHAICFAGNIFHYLIFLWKNRHDSIFFFHGIHPIILIGSWIQGAEKIWWRHCTIGSWKNANSKIKWMIMYFIQCIFQKRMNTICYVNDGEKNELLRFGFSGRYQFLPIPINTDFWGKGERKTEDPKEFHIVCIGTLSHRKNQLCILQACKKLDFRLGNRNIFLHLIGREEPVYKSILEDFIRTQNISKGQVILHGKRSPEYLRDILYASQLYIQPSFQEGQCQTVSEALMTNITVLLSHIPTFSQTYLESVRYFDPHEPSSLALQIQSHAPITDSYGLQDMIIREYSYQFFDYQVQHLFSTH